MIPLTELFHASSDASRMLYVPDTVFIQTPDTYHGAQMWTRYAQSDYQDGGFLSLDGKQKIWLKIFVRNDEDGAFYPYRNEEALKAFFDARKVEKKAIAIHYYPGRSVQSIVTGIDFGPDFFKDAS